MITIFRALEDCSRAPEIQTTLMRFGGVRVIERPSAFNEPMSCSEHIDEDGASVVIIAGGKRPHENTSARNRSLIQVPNYCREIYTDARAEGVPCYYLCFAIDGLSYQLFEVTCLIERDQWTLELNLNSQSKKLSDVYGDYVEPKKSIEKKWLEWDLGYSAEPTPPQPTISKLSPAIAYHYLHNLMH